jgi:hypothetical protein
MSLRFLDSILCRDSCQIPHTGHTGASTVENKDYGMGLCEAKTTVDRIQWTMNSLNCSVSPVMLSCTHNTVLWFCDGVTAFETPLGHSSIILMNSTWLPSVHTSHLITSSSGYGLHNLPHSDLPPLHSLQHGQAEASRSVSLTSIWL